MTVAVLVIPGDSGSRRFIFTGTVSSPPPAGRHGRRGNAVPRRAIARESRSGRRWDGSAGALATSTTLNLFSGGGRRAARPTLQSGAPGIVFSHLKLAGWKIPYCRSLTACTRQRFFQKIQALHPIAPSKSSRRSGANGEAGDEFGRRHAQVAGQRSDLHHNRRRMLRPAAAGSTCRSINY